MTAAHGLSEQTVEKIQAVLASVPEVEKAVVYGSRAQGNFKPGSDIDLTLFGEGLTEQMMSRIYWGLDDLLLPYKIDLSLFSQLKHTALIDHIRRVGIALYTREPAPQTPVTP
jgi:predicted nucleotidyltransferase